MNKRRRWAVAVVLLGTLTTVGLVGSSAVGPAVESEQLPAWILTATYITSARCKLCHKKQHEDWAKTKHGKSKFPWETGEVEKPEQLTGEAVYRYVTGHKYPDNTWSEKGTACEACHGPGSVHMRAKKEERKTTIVNSATLKEPRKRLSVCGRCPGQYTIAEQKFAANFRPGQDLFKIEGFVLAPVVEGRKLQQLNELRHSKHFEKGVTCITCHAVHVEAPLKHQLRKPAAELCSECHQDKEMATHAPTAAEGATCVSCHMPEGRHDFAPPPTEE